MKKVLALALSLALIATLAISGTVAYLQDTDEDVNVMTLGKVDIEQIEQEYNGKGELVDFTQGKPLYPYVGELGWKNEGEDGAYRQFTMENVVDKYVSVENTGKSPAYVRTIIALEQGDMSYADLCKFLGISVNAENGSEFKFPGTWNWEEIETVEIDGNNYNIMIATHADPVPAGETTIPSLLQVYLNKEADNEQVEQLDGNNNGTYDILVLSQAVQTQGFYATEEKSAALNALDTAFGEANVKNVADWFAGTDVPGAPVYVKNSEDLKTAIEAGETNLKLAAGTYHMPAAAKGKTLTISGSEETIIEVVPGGQGEANGQLDYNLDGSTVTFNGVTIKTNNQTYAGYARLTGTYNNVTFENTYCLNGDSKFTNCTMNISGDQYNIWTWGAPTATFDGCTFNSDGKAILLYGTVNTKLTVKNCVFNDKGGLTDLKAAIEIGNDYDRSYELIVNNTTVNGYEINDKGINTNTTLWANKNSMGTDKLNVVVDGVDVY